MALFLQFLTEQWILCAALVTCIWLLLNNEARKGGAKLSPREVVSLVNQEQAVILDLRDSNEFQKGHIVDALNIPQNKLADRLSELEEYRERPLVLVCKLGQHAGASGKLLAEKGFQSVYRLNGGMLEWQNDQLPVVK